MHERISKYIDIHEYRYTHIYKDIDVYIYVYMYINLYLFSASTMLISSSSVNFFSNYVLSYTLYRHLLLIVVNVWFRSSLIVSDLVIFTIISCIRSMILRFFICSPHVLFRTETRAQKKCDVFRSIIELGEKTYNHHTKLETTLSAAGSLIQEEACSKNY
jgi:hypothetical protein